MFRAGCFSNFYGGFGHSGFFGTSPFLMIIPMIIFWAALIYFLYKLLNNKKAELQSDLSSALDILNERYARGEINEEEYIAKKKQLRK